MDNNVWLKVSELINDCEASIVSVNDATIRLLGSGNLLLKQLSLPKPRKGCSELVFIRAIFWLSALFHECGGRPIKYCMRQSQFDDVEYHQVNFLRELRSIRTQVAHNLDISRDCDMTTYAICRNWYKRVCQAESPVEDWQWNSCSYRVLTEAVDLLKKIQAFLNFLECTSESALLLEGLRQAILAEISPYAFDDIVLSVASDMGRSDLNLTKFRADHFTRWTVALEKFPEGYDFHSSARKLVEKSFLENPECLPITGRDIIECLGVPQGEDVGRLLQCADRLFRGGLRERNALLEELRGSI